jgi:hypothetical protein
MTQLISFGFIPLRLSTQEMHNQVLSCPKHLYAHYELSASFFEQHSDGFPQRLWRHFPPHCPTRGSYILELVNILPLIRHNFSKYISSEDGRLFKCQSEVVAQR